MASVNTQQLLAAAWLRLNDAAADLSLVSAFTEDAALATDMPVVSDAVEGEIKALAAAALRWEQRWPNP